MSTIIDSLVLELGIDPKNFSKGQQEALNSLRNLEEESRKKAISIETSAGRAGSALGGIKTQALEMFAVFAGGKGLVQFAQETMKSNAQLGRLERNLGVSAQTIAKWQGAARIFGGDGAQMAQTITTISDAIEGFKIGDVKPLYGELRNLASAGGTVVDVNNGVNQTLLDISANLAKVHAQDPGRAGLLGRRLGLDPGLYDLLIKGPKATQEMLDKVNALGPATKEATDAAGELDRRWNSIAVKAEAKARGILPEAGRQIAGAADWMNKSPGEAASEFFSRDSWSWLLGASPQAKSPTGSGAFTSQAEKEAFIRSEAAQRGIDPDVAMKVARSEGFNSFQSTVPSARGPNGREDSWGSFQLYKGGGLGNEFQNATGLDPADRNNERASIAFALDYARKSGWGKFHGAANTGIGQWAGIGQGGSSTTTTVAINGPITINAGNNADGKQMGEKFVATIKRQSFAAQANTGQD